MDFIPLILQLNQTWAKCRSNLWSQPQYVEKPHSFTCKGYLHNKMKRYQNVSYEAQIKNFFISKKNYVLFSRYSNFCVFNHPNDLPNLWGHDEY